MFEIFTSDPASSSGALLATAQAAKACIARGKLPVIVTTVAPVFYHILIGGGDPLLIASRTGQIVSYRDGIQKEINTWSELSNYTVVHALGKILGGLVDEEELCARLGRKLGHRGSLPPVDLVAQDGKFQEMAELLNHG